MTVDRGFMHKTFVQRFNYLRQVSGVNGGDTVFVRRVSVCMRARSRPVNQTSLKRLKLYTDFKFDVHVSRDWPDMNPLFFDKRASVKIHLAEICTLTSAF